MVMKRIHDLTIGEHIFDISTFYFGKIADIRIADGVKKYLFTVDNWCERQNQILHEYDEMIHDDSIWENNKEYQIYQIADGYVDNRTNNIVCHEHMKLEDDYPYYSPYLNENLFSFEVSETTTA